MEPGRSLCVLAAVDPLRNLKQRKGPHYGDPLQPSLQVALPFLSIELLLKTAGRRCPRLKLAES